MNRPRLSVSGAGSTLTALASALVPKCPLCLAAMLGPFSIWLPRSPLLPWALLLPFLAAPLLILARRHRGVGSRAALAVGCSSALLITLSRADLLPAFLTLPAICVLALTVIWSGPPRYDAAASPGPERRSAAKSAGSANTAFSGFPPGSSVSTSPSEFVSARRAAPPTCCSSLPSPVQPPTKVYNLKDISSWR
jgi:hypothetical protein